MIYRKRGAVVRWENGTLIRIREEGIAREDGGVFECEPANGPGADLVFEPADVRAIAHEVRDAADGITIERLVIVDGRSEHQYGDHRWVESTGRMHVALTHARLRVLVDLASFDVNAVADLARVLRRLDERIDSAPAALRIAPGVTAALLPLYTGRAPAGSRIVQTAGGVDGYGAPIVEADRDWPNAFRPSYRIAPRRMPMNVRIEGAAGPIDPSLPRAVALLGVSSDGSPRLLLDDGERSWAATVRLERVRAVAPPADWYPYAAGSFGAEMML
jgi:hypothetical protein